jgi:hypothetical protein
MGTVGGKEVCGWTGYHVCALPSNLATDGGSSLFRIRQCLSGPRMDWWQCNGGRMKTPAEAGLRICSCLFLVVGSVGGGPHVHRKTVGGE